MAEIGMTKTRFLEIVRAQHARWNDLLAEVGDDHMLEPGVTGTGDWTLKDVIAHTGVWERWRAAGWLGDLRGQKATIMERTGFESMPEEVRGGGYEAFNRWAYEQTRHFSLQEARDYAQKAYELTLQAIEEATGEDISSHEKQFASVSWKGDLPMWLVIAGISYQHQQEEHMPAIRSWLGKSNPAWPEGMSKEKFLEAMKATRAELESVLDQVGVERMEVPGVEGTDWSVKDILGHITMYERWLAENLEASLRGISLPLPNPIYSDMKLDERNDWIYRHYKDKPAQEVLDESRAVFAYLVDLVNGISEPDLIEQEGHPQWKEWIDPTGFHAWKYIESESFGHYPQHLSSIKDWLKSA